jgi:hypothetical protein
MVFEWTALHQRELIENGVRLRNAASIAKIAPLE